MFAIDRARMSILIAIGIIASVAYSHRGMAAECPDPFPKKPTAAQFVACINKLKENMLPSSAVVAFDLQGGCPTGWSEFTDAAGKVIIGVGEGSLKKKKDLNGQVIWQDLVLKDHKYRAEGGEEKHKLNTFETPNHVHYIKIKSEKIRIAEEGDERNVIVPDETAQDTTESAGVGKPHNNMPPYIALFFCKKD